MPTSKSLTEIRTAVGLLDAEVCTTYHVDWLTYAHVRAAGKMGLEDIFKLAYGKEMEMLESSNDTDYSMQIHKEKIDAYDQSNLDKCIRQGCFENYYLRLFLTDLANKNIIPEGRYVVRMSW